jgi:hypothetical protein
MRLYLGFPALLSLAGLLALAACAGSGQPTAGVPAATGVPPTAVPAQPAATAELPTGYPVQPAATTESSTAYPVQPAATPELPTGYPAAKTAVVDAVSRQAAAKLAATLSVDVSQIQVISAEAKDWPDTSLGCPQPGIAYAQVVTPGYRVVLAYKQTQYEYHADQKGQLVTCQPK